MSSEDGLKTYHYRFAKFVQYLKEKDAEIRLPNGITYYAKTKRNKPKLIDLLCNAAGMPKSTAEKLMSADLELRHFSTNKGQSTKLGKFIDAIHFYYSSDGLVIENSNKVYEKEPFSIRPIEESVRVFEPDEVNREGLLYYQHEKGKFIPLYDKWDNFYFGKDYKKMFARISKLTKKYPYMFSNCFKGEEKGYPFNEIIKKLHLLYGDWIFENNKDFETLLHKITEIYSEKSKQKKRYYHLIPYYPDFYLPIRKNLALKSYNKHFRNELWFKNPDSWFNNPNSLKLEKLLKFRYELIYKLIESGIEVEKLNLLT